MNRLRALLSRRLVRAGLASYAFTGLTLAVNLVSGIAVARALGPDGRGVTVAVVMVMQILGQMVSMGATTSLSYHAAREPERVPDLYATWLALLLPVALVAILLAELLLPTLFAAQDDEALHLARIFLLNVVLILTVEVDNGLLLGTHDFFFFNVARFIQPAGIAVTYVVLWALDALTVELALITWTLATVATVVTGSVRLLSRHGFGRPDRALGRRPVWWGLRAHGDALAGTLTVRLDVAILPAFVVATALGLYSIAANVSLIVAQLGSVLAAIVLPAAARDEAGARRTVVTSLQVTVLTAGALAAALFAFARPALELVYGDAFGGAAEALRILLPGVVMFGAASVLGAGINAAGRPLTATLSQVAGGVVTLAGLLIFVPDGGIRAAAIVSTVAYGVVFAGNLFMYRRIARLSWGEFLRAPARAATHTTGV